MIAVWRELSLRVLIHLLLLRPFVRLFFGVNLIGRENLRHLDHYLLIANHNSHLDVLLLFYLLPVSHISRTSVVAAEEYFGKSRFSFALVNYLFRPIWLTRGRANRTENPLARIGRAIGSGRNVILFPEGTRGMAGRMQPFRSGIGRLAARYTDIPVVPVFLAGTEKSLPKKSVLPLPIWNQVVVGPPRMCSGTHQDMTRSLERVLRDLSESEIARRHRRRPLRTSRAPSIACVGIDGSGKSTLSKRIAVALSSGASTCLISDRLEFYEDSELTPMQPLLTDQVRRAIGAYAKRAESLKTYRIPKLTELLFRNHLVAEVRKWHAADYIILDGSPLLNLVAWAALYSSRAVDTTFCSTAIAVLTDREDSISRNDPIYGDFPVLKILKRLKLARMEIPDSVVCIDLSPEVACGRIEARGERRQVHETTEKLACLRRAYLNVCQTIQRERSVPATVLDGQATPNRLSESAMAFVRGSLTKGAVRGREG